MIKRNNKKGFTIVELVIVIAVIAILAAVLIPTFAGIIKKANLSADQQAVRQMNTVLTAEFAAEAPASIKEVIDVLDENGYNVDALTPLTKDHQFLWLEGTNTIILVTGTTVVYPVGVEFSENNKNLYEDGASFINKEVNSATDLKSALEKGNDVTLTSDVANAAEIIIPDGANVTLDLGGFKYTTEQLNADDDNNRTSKYIKIGAGASLTIQNGTFEGRGIMNNGGTLTIKAGTTVNATDIGGGCIKNKTNGTVVIEGGTFNVATHVDYTDANKGGAVVVENAGGNVTINGGTFTSVTDNYVVSNVSGNTTINGGTFNGTFGCVDATAGTVTINAGEFKLENGAGGHHLFANNGAITYTDSVVFSGVGYKECILDGGSGSITKK